MAEIRPIPTNNVFGAGANEHGTAIQISLFGVKALATEDAANLAAWLIVMIERTSVYTDHEVLDGVERIIDEE